MNLSVKVVGGKDITLSVTKTMTVSEVKSKIKEETQVLPDQQRLIYKGRVLKNEQTLESCGLEVP